MARIRDLDTVLEHKPTRVPFRVVPEPWTEQALCAQTDPELFYPEKGESTTAAKRVCYSCPVRWECLDYAIDHAETLGVWGGYSPRERAEMRRTA